MGQEVCYYDPDITALLTHVNKKLSLGDTCLHCVTLICLEHSLKIIIHNLQNISSSLEGHLTTSLG